MSLAILAWAIPPFSKSKNLLKSQSPISLLFVARAENTEDKHLLCTGSNWIKELNSVLTLFSTLSF